MTSKFNTDDDVGPRMRNPVHYVVAPFRDLDDHGSNELRPAGWYFWDETWAHRHGPFASLIVANQECEKYARGLDDDRDTLENLGVDVI